MRGAVRRLLLRLAGDARLHGRIGHARLAAFVTRVETRHTLFCDALFRTAIEA
jgi:hypothetical protein